jgi:hypothetical protein
MTSGKQPNEKLVFFRKTWDKTGLPSKGKKISIISSSKLLYKEMHEGHPTGKRKSDLFPIRIQDITHLKWKTFDRVVNLSQSI